MTATKILSKTSKKRLTTGTENPCLTDIKGGRAVFDNPWMLEAGVTDMNKYLNFY